MKPLAESRSRGRLRRTGVPRLALLIAASMAFSACVDRSDGDGAVEGNAVPAVSRYLDVELPRLGRAGSMRLRDFAGRPSVVNFFASWCAPCVREMPEIEAVKQQADGALVFVGIDVQEPEADGLALVDDTGVTWELARDPEGVLVRATGGRGMPTTLLLDGAGRIVFTRTGEMSSGDLREAIRGSLGIEIGPP